jgi:hypothetical protein
MRSLKMCKAAAQKTVTEVHHYRLRAILDRLLSLFFVPKVDKQSSSTGRWSSQLAFRE